MPNSIDSVDKTVLSLKDAIEGLLEDDALFRFDICVIEALTNVVKHAKTSDVNAPVQITLTLKNDKVIVDIFDPVGATYFDIREHAPDMSDIDEMAESGRGLALILQCANDVQYGPWDNQNRLSLTFENGVHE
ncbi:ATP-binding protein [Yoonia maritima]|uniref:ATP-binding protein n=1 Tax=Yoonia maritima TaxID=1435347 RepID=UPI000D0EF1E8|nr:ATP-binding protein [Yoonia maritima]